jgi:MoxR-like ATPase
MNAEQQAAGFKADFERLRSEVGRVMVGLDDIIEHVLIALVGDGHVLLEGVPGLGKTLLVRTLAQALDLRFSRIQFTPDLMPADITGTDLVVESETGERTFRFQPGPVFAHLVLADEINRATPKTQSALLEAMQEHSVTVGGTVRRLEEPFLVMATENPIEMEGTYPLPEAQLDRFLFKLLVPYPSIEQLGVIVDRTTGAEVPEARPVLDRGRLLEMRRFAREVAIADHVKQFALRLVAATHPEGDQAGSLAKRYLRYGASPRGAQALVVGGKVSALLDGRFNVAFDDIARLAPAALRHRVLLNFEGEAEGIAPDAIVADVVEDIRRGAAETLPV